MSNEIDAQMQPIVIQNFPKRPRGNHVHDKHFAKFEHCYRASDDTGKRRCETGGTEDDFETEQTL